MNPLRTTMPSNPIDLKFRADLFDYVLPKEVATELATSLQSSASLAAALDALGPKVDPEQRALVVLANSVADISNDNPSLVKALLVDKNVESLRQVATGFSVDDLSKMVDPKDLPKDAPGATPDEKTKNFALGVRDRLFNVETSGVLQRMLTDKELPIPAEPVRAGLEALFTNLPKFDIRTESVYNALKDPKAFEGVPQDQQAAVADQLKIVQRVQAMTTAATAVPTLMDAGLHSALSVSQLSQSAFMAAYGDKLGQDVALSVYNNALNIHIRNENALMAMHETIRAAGPGIVYRGPGEERPQMVDRLTALQKEADDKGVPLNLDSLFHDMDRCACDDCLSVYSPASYFVELLQYLRNDNLNPNNPNTGQKTMDGTPLQALFNRRPDLGCLELTCENAFTPLPYIDLATEVMESFIVHNPQPKDPIKLEAFNTLDETASELAAQPQHVNYEAYCILKQAVYPFTLPYHQPIDVARIWLNYMGTSRYEVLKRFRTPHEPNAAALPDSKKADVLHAEVQDRAVDAEFLGLTQEEYIILTKEAFWPKDYFSLTLGAPQSDNDYQSKIGVHSTGEYYGYQSDAASSADAKMLDVTEADQLGLTFVKKQFLPRTGLNFAELVDLLQTRWINPNMPEGRALVVLDSIRLSYRFLQSLVDTGAADPDTKYAKLIAALDVWQPLVPAFQSLLHPDPCHEHLQCECLQPADLKKWVLCYFERVGKLIVLETGEGPILLVSGTLTEDTVKPNVPVGTLLPTGVILDDAGKPIGSVTLDGKVQLNDGTAYPPDHRQVKIIGPQGQLGFIANGRLTLRDESRSLWAPPRDTCNLDATRLVHLDGTPLEAREYERMHRFIRLWRKLGWTQQEVDQALCGSLAGAAAGPGGGPGGSGLASGAAGFVTYDEFKDDCAAEASDGNDCGCDGPPLGSIGNCPDPIDIPATVTPDVIAQLAAIQKVMNQTGLPVEKQLTWWANIGTFGSKSLYASLFLTHNIKHLDPIFEADANGNFLAQGAKLSDHLPGLAAALRLRAEDIAAIVDFRGLPDALTQENASVLYRHGLLARLLHVKPADLKPIVALFGDPFKSPKDAYSFLKAWGQMEDAGFTFAQLNYVIQDGIDPRKPIAPTDRAVLGLAKVLFDGLNAIDQANADVPVKDPANPTPDELARFTSELVRVKAALLYDSGTVERLMGLLEGTAAYVTNAPPNLVIAIPDALKGEVAYSNKDGAAPPQASLQITGILSAADVALAKGLSANADWSKAIDRAGKQPRHFFDQSIGSVFSDTNEAVAHLLAPDVNAPFDTNNPAAFDQNTPPRKRLYFLTHFLPFLRKRLEANFIVSTLAGLGGLSNDVTRELLGDVLKIDGAPALETFRSIKDQPKGAPAGWKGDLVPPTTDEYTFYAINSDAKPSDLVIGGTSYEFKGPQDDPSNVWWTDPANPVKLKAGTPYTFDSGGLFVSQLNWKTDSLPLSPIPSTALLPDYASAGTKIALVAFVKAAIVVSGFNLTADEIEYLNGNANFDDIDLNALKLPQWKRLCDYATLRDSLPKTGTTLLDLFKWADPNSVAFTAAQKATDLPDRLYKLTVWNEDKVRALIASTAYDFSDPALYVNEKPLVKLQKALKVSDAAGATIDALFRWANPSSKFSDCHTIASEIQATLRSRYEQSDWEKVVEPLHDQLRKNQQAALVAYLLVQPYILDWAARKSEVLDADTLFEFLLIDVQMDPCMKTSRIVQAIASVHTFVKRSMMGLETPDVPPDVLDRDRWEWMQNYRVWEANRKVFLYPENWIRPELRDDKSPFYKELEADLLQHDVNTQNIEDALKNFLYNVDEVANLRIIGLYFELNGLDKTGAPARRLHIFGSTPRAPFTYYYRFALLKANDYSVDEWYPWEKVQVDIPSYVLGGEDGSPINETGVYLTPVVWGARLFIFFPIIATKSKPGKLDTSKTFVEGSNSKIDEAKPKPFHEIRLAWSEYRNGKWTQKRVSNKSVVDDQANIAAYGFVPSTHDGGIDVFVFRSSETTSFGSFSLRNGELFVTNSTDSIAVTLGTEFSYVGNSIHSLQQEASGKLPFSLGTPSFDRDSADLVAYDYQATQIIVGNARAPRSQEMMNIGGTPALYGDLAKWDDALDLFGRHNDGLGTSFNELKSPNAIYNWELGMHVPMTIADKQMTARQFEQALSMCQYVFDPLACPDPGGNIPLDKRFWRFPPFRFIEPHSLQQTFLALKPNTSDDQINKWRDNPFNPHSIARGRPTAYMKYVAMKYIEILIAYGDYYFRQNSLETIPLAIQCYVLASHLYGPEGEVIPKRGKIEPETYNSLQDKWDAFGNAMVELELAFPFSNQITTPIGGSVGTFGLANIFGFANSLYFCIPDNPNLLALKATIDDRLFKIRHCEDINGVFRQLPLFQPPIDPALLVEAVAAGLSISSVLNDLASPMPNYRFNYLLQKALELCTELKSLGGAFVSAKEKGDSESYAQLKAGHDTAIQNLVMSVRQKQLDEANAALDALEQSRVGPAYQLTHTLKLLGEDLSKVPSEDGDFAELADAIEPPVDESGLKIGTYEKEEMDKAGAAKDWNTGIGGVETLAGVFHAIPSINAAGHPLGVGVDVLWGFPNLANALSATARGLKIYADILSFESSNAGRKAGFLKQMQERVQRANELGYQIKNIDKQILTQKIRIDIANQEIANQQKQIDNAQETEDFLRNKYTNKELYSWMQGQVSGLYYRAYTMAYELAKKAEKLYRFERGLSDSTFIQFGYWEGGHDGLLCGERLYNGLKDLERAYFETRGHDFEIPKSISLRQIDPIALLTLRETGTCEFALPEVLFDMDWPGHYSRRIKAVSVRIPCVVGPYTSLNCTLRLLENQVRISSRAQNKADYPEDTSDGASDDRFTTFNVPIKAIAVGSNEEDSGLFELNFHDERYLPFEGAGVISRWRLELPNGFKQFDYDTISDVVLRLRYTSLDGGDKLKDAASGSVKDFVDGKSDDEGGLFVAFDLKSDFSNAWYSADTSGVPVTLTLDRLAEKLPFFTTLGTVTFSNLTLLATNVSGANYLDPEGPVPFIPLSPLSKTLQLASAEVDIIKPDALSLQFPSYNKSTDKMWLIAKYQIK